MHLNCFKYTMSEWWQQIACQNNTTDTFDTKVHTYMYTHIFNDICVHVCVSI
jgi:hypothetical protein